MKTTNKYTIPAYICNSEGYLKTRYLLNLMFEVAFDQSSIVEKGIKEDKLVWIVYSWDVEIIDPLMYKDEIEVTTFAIDMRKFYAYRNFEVKKDGKTVALAYCVFLLLDIEEKTLVRIPEKLIDAYGKEETIYKGRKNTYAKEFDIEREIEVRKADIDINGHVNNAAYMELVREIVDIKDQEIEYFSIIYKNEVRNQTHVFAKAIVEDNEADFKLYSDEDKIYTYGKLIKRNV